MYFRGILRTLIENTTKYLFALLSGEIYHKLCACWYSCIHFLVQSQMFTFHLVSTKRLTFELDVSTTFIRINSDFNEYYVIAIRWCSFGDLWFLFEGPASYYFKNLLVHLFKHFGKNSDFCATCIHVFINTEFRKSYTYVSSPLWKCLSFWWQFINILLYFPTTAPTTTTTTEGKRRWLTWVNSDQF